MLLSRVNSQSFSILKRLLQKRKEIASDDTNLVSLKLGLHSQHFIEKVIPSFQSFEQDSESEIDQIAFRMSNGIFYPQIKYKDSKAFAEAVHKELKENEKIKKLQQEYFKDYNPEFHEQVLKEIY